MLWAGAFFALVFVLGIFVSYKIKHTALVVVHPWNFGFYESEMQDNLRTFQELGLTPNDPEFVAKHLNYNRCLGNFLRTHIYAHTVLFEEVDKEELTLKRIEEIQNESALVRILRSLLKVGFEFTKTVIITEVGKAKPANGKSWHDVITELKQKGIKEVHIVGCYMGIKDGMMVYDPKRYGHYCINEVFAMLSFDNHFKDVCVLPKVCYYRIID